MTYYENAGKNYYDSSLGTGNYNTITSNNSTKTEVVKVDTGSHKGIKGGTKACTFTYESVETGSEYTAGEQNTQEASGGIVISGGTITVDTTNTGIKYNGSMGMGGNNPFGGNGQLRNNNNTTSGSSNLSAANEDQYIIGSPDDGIHSNYTCEITGGKITVLSADDGITAASDLTVTGAADINIKQCYEGIEAGNIVIGAEHDETDGPKIRIYSNDDGVNAAYKTVDYVYTDETEEQYTKTQTSSTDNELKIYSGYLNIMIADDVTHTFDLPVAGGENTTGTYTADGDGIDCNGSFYAYGGTVVVFGPTGNDNSPIDTDATYYIGEGVTLLAVGSNGMIENPTSLDQAAITYTGNSGGQPGGMQRPDQNSSDTTTVSALAITDADGNVVLAIQPNKTYSYVLYSSPELDTTTTYTLYTGGTVSKLLNTDESCYDYRYCIYDNTGATSSSITASKAVTQNQTGPGGQGNPRG